MCQLQLVMEIKPIVGMCPLMNYSYYIMCNHACLQLYRLYHFTSIIMENLELSFTIHATDASLAAPPEYVLLISISTCSHLQLLTASCL